MKKYNLTNKLLLLLFLLFTMVLLALLVISTVENRLRVMELEHDVVELKNKNVELQIIIDELEEEKLK